MMCIRGQGPFAHRLLSTFDEVLDAHMHMYSRTRVHACIYIYVLIFMLTLNVVMTSPCAYFLHRYCCYCRV